MMLKGSDATKHVANDLGIRAGVELRDQTWIPRYTLNSHGIVDP